jgi:hypothetical protein
MMPPSLSHWGTEGSGGTEPLFGLRNDTMNRPICKPFKAACGAKMDTAAMKSALGAIFRR